jgi:Mn2+/Fe2+ NRAMP family transporter
MMKRIKELFRIMGPGLLYAGAAIGVSHLVQSTRAGADFGFQLIWAIVLANVMKYPFFQFAPRYTASTGNTLIDGYRILGKWAVILYFVLTITTMFAIQGAISIVTAGLFGNIFGIALSPTGISAILLIAALVILVIGKYSVLDKLIKWVILILTISTIVALIASISNGYNPKPEFLTQFDFGYLPHIAFLIALFGWMPAPIDISVWQSIWAKAKSNEQKIIVTKKQALLDFNIGYIGTAVLAVGFLLLGAYVMYGSGEKLSDNGAEFSGQLISMYTHNLGSWAYVFIATAALMTMISTLFTVFDAYARVLVPTTDMIFSNIKSNLKINAKSEYVFWLIIILIGTLLLLTFFATNMRFMVDFATILSFIIAPIFAVLNLKVITHSHVPKEDQPKLWMRIYAFLGIVLLTAFSLYYIYFRLFLG